MSTEIDLATELATVKAQLKEQTQQMAEMASMMKSMMSLAMPLLEEQTRKLHMEKAAEAALKKEEEERKRKEKAAKAALKKEEEERERKREERERKWEEWKRKSEERARRIAAEQMEAALEKKQKEKELAMWFEKEKIERNTKPLGDAIGDFYQEKSKTWWRCPADDKLHVFRWEKGGSETLVNWKGEAWVCRRAGAGFGEIMYQYADAGNWIGVYVRGEDRWDHSGPPRSANIPPPPSGPVYPNGRPGDSVMIAWDYSKCPWVPGSR